MLLTHGDLKFLWFRDKAYNMEHSSIDRINPQKHYTLENCRYIEYRENCRQGGLKTKADYISYSTLTVKELRREKRKIEKRLRELKRRNALKSWKWGKKIKR